MSTAPLLQVELGPEDRAELARDLSAVADVRRVVVDDGQGLLACRIDEAFAAIEAGRARRVQIRYRYDGFTWCDTLVCNAGTVRLVRMDESDAEAESESESESDVEPPASGCAAP